MPAISFTEVVGARYFRMLFPKAHNAPHWRDYIEQKQAEGKSFEEGFESYTRMFGRGEERMSVEDAIALLMAAPAYRAHIVAHFTVAVQNALQVWQQRDANDVCPNCGSALPV